MAVASAKGKQQEWLRKQHDGAVKDRQGDVSLPAGAERDGGAPPATLALADALRRQKGSVYPSTNPLQTQTSSVDIELLEGDHVGRGDELRAQFPSFARLGYFEVVLRPGMQLFIPRGWWHYCRSETTSFSVNHFWL